MKETISITGQTRGRCATVSHSERGLKLKQNELPVGYNKALAGSSDICYLIHSKV